jgi:predicted nucleic acid-binding protein
MIGTVFVDTNVFLYARDSRDALKQSQAASWLEYLWREQLGRTSVQVLSEYYVNVTRKLRPGLPPEEAWEDVTALLVWRPQPIDEAVLHGGRDIERRYRLSWWDALVVAAASLQGCAVVLSEDFQDGAEYGGISVRSPFTLAAGENIAAYQAVPAVSYRAPLRGRPKASGRLAQRAQRARG